MRRITKRVINGVIEKKQVILKAEEQKLA